MRRFGLNFIADSYSPTYALKPYNLFHIAYKIIHTKTKKIVYIVSPKSFHCLMERTIDQIIVVDCIYKEDKSEI